MNNIIPIPEKMDLCDTQIRAIYEAVWGLEARRDALIARSSDKELSGIQVRIDVLRGQARVIEQELDVLIAGVIETGSDKELGEARYALKH